MTSFRPPELTQPKTFKIGNERLELVRASLEESHANKGAYETAISFYGKMDNEISQDISVPGGYFSKNIEIRAASCLPGRNIVFIENIPAHMLHCIDTESVHTHVNIVIVGIN